MLWVSAGRSDDADELRILELTSWAQQHADLHDRLQNVSAR
jgi:hypothetical protein